MRVALLADIHANFVALEAVQIDLQHQGVAGYWFLGDLVGYGPSPVECVRFLHDHALKHETRWAVGNHDGRLVSLPHTGDFGHEAQAVIERHRTIIQQDRTLWAWCQHAFRDEAHVTPQVYQDGATRFVLVHACLTPGLYVGPTATSYLYPHERELLHTHAFKPLRELAGDETTTCLLYGHTHMPAFCVLARVAAQPLAYRRLLPITYGHPTALPPGLVALNPGSVGQPRDGDNRAAYAILDTSAATIEFRRVTYRHVRTQRLMQGYPERFVKRIFHAGDHEHSNDLVRFRTVYRPEANGLAVVEELS